MTNEQIERVLTAAVGHHIGASAGKLDRADFAQMFDAGYIGRDGGLTRRGSILAQRLKREQEERLFPL